MNNWLTDLLEQLGLRGKARTADSQEHIRGQKAVRLREEWIKKAEEISDENDPKSREEIEETREKVDRVHNEYIEDISNPKSKSNPMLIALVIIFGVCFIGACIYTANATNILPCWLGSEKCPTPIAMATATPTKPATTSAPVKPTETFSPIASRTNTTVQNTVPLPTVTHSPIPPTTPASPPPIPTTAVPTTVVPTTPVPTTAVPPTDTPTDTPTATPTLQVGITVSASRNFSDQCPAAFYFTAYISTNRATSITYQWEKSDGEVLQLQTLNFFGAQTLEAIPLDWRFNVTAPYSYNGWARLRVLSPENLISNTANFSIDCPRPPDTPTNTPVPTVPPPPPTNTNTPTPVPIPAGDFRNLTPVEASNSACRYEILNNSYQIRVSDKSRCISVYPKSYTDFDMNMDAQILSGDGYGGGAIYIVFGYKNRDNYFALVVTRNDQKYGIGKVVNGTPSDVYNWSWRTDSALASPNANGITLDKINLSMRGNNLQVKFNNKLVDQFSIPNYSTELLAMLTLDGLEELLPFAGLVSLISPTSASFFIFFGCFSPSASP